MMLFTVSEQYPARMRHNTLQVLITRNALRPTLQTLLPTIRAICSWYKGCNNYEGHNSDAIRTERGISDMPT